MGSAPALLLACLLFEWRANDRGASDFSMPLLASGLVLSALALVWLYLTTASLVLSLVFFLGLGSVAGVVATIVPAYAGGGVRKYFVGSVSALLLISVALEVIYAS